MGFKCFLPVPRQSKGVPAGFLIVFWGGQNNFEMMCKFVQNDVQSAKLFGISCAQSRAPGPHGRATGAGPFGHCAPALCGDFELLYSSGAALWTSGDPAPHESSVPQIQTSTVTALIGKIVRNDVRTRPVDV